jgi:hypothetical protein
MSRDEEIRAVLLNLLSTGLLRVRASAWDGLIEKCALEADHLHNLPALVGSLNPATLRYYYEKERPRFMKSVSNTAGFDADWERLGALLADSAGSPDGNNKTQGVPQVSP